MSIENQQENEISPQIEDILLLLSDSIKSQEKLNYHTGRRISQIVRYATLIIILLFIAVIFLAWSQKHDTDAINNMAKNISLMGNAISKMQTNTKDMDDGISQMASHTRAMSNAIVQTDGSEAILSDISDSVKLMQKDSQGFNKNLEAMNYNLSTINNQIRKLNKKLGVMGHEVNRKSSPSRMFPF